MPEDIPKLLIVDASILFSFFKKGSGRRIIIEELYEFGCKLISPAFAFKELAKNKESGNKNSTVNQVVLECISSLL